MTVYYTYAANLTALTKARAANVASNFTAVEASFVVVNSEMVLKAPLASPALTGTPTAPTAVAATNSTQLATTAHVFAERTNAATLTNKTLTSPAISTPTGIVKGDVGLGNVDNTSDANKPVSTATQTALNLKANLASPTFTGTVALPSTTSIGTVSATELAYVDGVTSAIQTQIDLKANLASPTFTGVPAAPTATTGTATTQLATTAFVGATAFSAALPSQTGNAGKLATTDGTDASWTTVKTVNGASLLGSGDIAVGPSLLRSARTSNTALAAADKGYLIDITSGTFTQTFIAVATLADGWFAYIRNAGTGDITLDPNSTEQIDGLTSYVMYPGEVRLVQCNGTALRSVVLTPFFKTFTASGTFTKPPGYTRFGLNLWGAGGSGKKDSAASNRAGGGGGGCAVGDIQASDIGTTQAVTIGAGGAAITVDGTSGLVGGSSTFSLYVAYGGAGGTSDGSGGSIFVSNLGFADSHVFGSAGNTTTNISYMGGGTSGAAANRGKATWGGAAGGSIDSAGTLFNDQSTIFGGARGNSVLAGAGGIVGSAPGGGGGATATGTASGAGARGELRIWGAI